MIQDKWSKTNHHDNVLSSSKLPSIIPQSSTLIYTCMYMTFKYMDLTDWLIKWKRRNKFGFVNICRNLKKEKNSVVEILGRNIWRTKKRKKTSLRRKYEYLQSRLHLWYSPFHFLHLQVISLIFFVHLLIVRFHIFLRFLCVCV